MKKKKKVSWSPSPPSSRRRRLFGATAILIMLMEDDVQKIELEITSSQRWVGNSNFLILKLASIVQKPREIFV